MTVTDTRNLSRENLFLLADMQVEGDPASYRIKVRNLSAGGMMGEGGVRVIRGSRLKIDFGSAGTVGGSVAWVQGERFGVAFDDEVDCALVKSASR